MPEIAGELSFAGPVGVEVRPEGLAGPVESSTYVTPEEQALTLPAASVAVALNVVEESSATAAVIPLPQAGAGPGAGGADPARERGSGAGRRRGAGAGGSRVELDRRSRFGSAGDRGRVVVPRA